MTTEALTADALPMLPLVLGGALLSVAALLMTAGRGTLRFAFGLSGLVIGFAAGWLIFDALALPLPAWIGAVFGGSILGAFFLLVFRLAIAMVLAGVLSIAAPLSLKTAGLIQLDQAEVGLQIDADQAPPPPSEEERIAAPTESMGDQIDRFARDRARDAVLEAAGRELDRAGFDQTRRDALSAWASDRRDAMTARWEMIDATGRARLRAAAATGAVIGLLLGLALPALTAILASAGTGAALAIIGLRLITDPLGLEGVGQALDRAVVLAALWTLLAMGSTALQWTRRPRRADTRKRSG